MEILAGDTIIISAIHLNGLADLFEKSMVAIRWEHRNDDLLPIEFTPKFETHPGYAFHR